MPEPVDLNDLTPDQLNDMMVNGDYSTPVDDAAPVAPEVAPEEAAAPEPEPEEVEQPEPVEDPRDRRIRELEQHNSRLAGKLGYLESRKAAEPGAAAAEPEYNPDPHADDPNWGESFDERIRRIEEEQDAVRQAHAAREQDQVRQVDQRIVQHATRLMAPIDADIKATVFQAHADEIQEIENYTDPRERETAALEVIQRASLEAQVFQMGRNQERAAAAKQASTAANYRAKVAQTVSGSGGVPSPPPRPKSVKDMSGDEADQWLRENVR